MAGDAPGLRAVLGLRPHAHEATAPDGSRKLVQRERGWNVLQLHHAVAVTTQDALPREVDDAFGREGDDSIAHVVEPAEVATDHSRVCQ